MNLTDKYMAFVKNGNFTRDERDGQFLAALGLCGESGEVSEIIKKNLIHGEELDLDHLKEELGDVLWYFFHALHTYNLTFEEIVEGNIRKLCDRHPKKNGDPKNWIYHRSVYDGEEEHSEIMRAIGH